MKNTTSVGTGIALQRVPQSTDREDWDAWSGVRAPKLMPPPRRMVAVSGTRNTIQPSDSKKVASRFYKTNMTSLPPPLQSIAVFGGSGSKLELYSATLWVPDPNWSCFQQLCGFRIQTGAVFSNFVGSGSKFEQHLATFWIRIRIPNTELQIRKKGVGLTDNNSLGILFRTSFMGHYLYVIFQKMILKENFKR